MREWKWRPHHEIDGFLATTAGDLVRYLDAVSRRAFAQEPSPGQLPDNVAGKWIISAPNWLDWRDSETSDAMEPEDTAASKPDELSANRLESGRGYAEKHSAFWLCLSLYTSVHAGLLPHHQRTTEILGFSEAQLVCIAVEVLSLNCGRDALDSS